MTQATKVPLLGLPPERFRAILGIGLPIMGGMLSQNILNLVDTAMVSRVPNSDAAIAAINVGGFVNFLCVAFVTGLAMGVQAMASRRKGEGRECEMAVPLNGGLVMVVVIALPLSAILVMTAPYFFPGLNPDPTIVALGVPYLQARLVAMTAVGANFAFRGYWNGIGRSTLYLRTLVVMHAANIVISYVLIFGVLGAPELGVQGAGIGTAASGFIGTLYYFYLGRRYAKDAGFLRGIPGWATMKSMIKISVPSGMQQLFFAAGFVVLFVIIGQLGKVETAAAGIVITITLVAILPGIALGISAASLVGQALGRKDVPDATRWGWDVIRVAAVVMGALGLPMLVVPELLLAPLAPSAEALDSAVGPLRVVGASIMVDAVGMVLMNAMMGAGATRSIMVVSISLQWGLFLPAAYIVGPYLGYGLVAIWLAQTSYRGLQAIILVGMWRSQRWATVKM